MAESEKTPERSPESAQLDEAAIRRLQAALPDDELLEQLEAIHGVGVKVASCVMRFGYHRLASAPVDVWIRRVIDEDYGGRSPFPAYGEHAGIFQQYLFYGRIAQKG